MQGVLVVAVFDDVVVWPCRGCAIRRAGMNGLEAVPRGSSSLEVGMYFEHVVALSLNL